MVLEKYPDNNSMEESKDKDVSMVSASESTVTVNEHVTGETPVDTVPCTVQGQIEGSLSEGVGAEESETCNGEDIMVEVLGSDVYVGGVCTSGSGESLNDEMGHGGAMEVEVGSKEGADTLDDEAVGSDLQGPRVSDSVEERSQAAEAAAEVGVVTRDGGSDQAAEVGTGTDQRKGSDGGETQDAGVASHVDGSSAVVDSTGGETQVVDVGDVEVDAKGEEIKGEMVESVACENHGLEDVNIQEVAVVDNTMSAPGVKDGLGGSSVGPSGGETQIIVQEVTTTENEESVGELVKEGVDQGGKSIDDGADTPDELKTQKVGVKDDEVWNPGIETMVVCSSATVEDTNVQTQTHKDKASVIVNEEGLDTEKQRNIAVIGELAAVDKEGNLGSSVAVTENDATVECLGQKLDNKQVKIELLGDSNKNNSNMHASDSDISSLHTQVVVEGQVAVTDRVLSNAGETIAFYTSQIEPNTRQDMDIDDKVNDAEQVDSDRNDDEVVMSKSEGPGSVESDQLLKSEDYIEKGVTDDVLPVDTDTAPETEAKEKVADANQVGLHVEQQIEVENKQENGDEVAGLTENQVVLHTDMTSLCQPPQVVQTEVTALNENVSINTKVEASDSVDKVCSQNDQKSKTETVWRSTETDGDAADYGDVALMDTDEVLNSAIELPKCPEDDPKLSIEEVFDKHKASDSSVTEINIASDVGVEEKVADPEEVGLHGEQDSEVEKEAIDTEQLKTDEDKIVAWEAELPGSSSVVNQPKYDLPPESEGVLSVSDIVWGKVKSHPWWPGQIFDFTDASERAMKYHKKDCFLVAYFGDRTFAWNDHYNLKNFRTHFSQIEKQCNSETFQNAVNCALKEVSRRIELGLACSCIPKDSYDKIKFQIVENAGIRQESSRRDGTDDSIASGSSFQADKLIQYIKELAQSSSGGCDRLELVIAKAQLLAFYRLKGYSSLPEFQFCGSLVENETDSSLLEDKIHSSEVMESANLICKDDGQSAPGQDMLIQYSSSHKRKHNLRDGIYPKIKERSLTELMGDVDSPDGEFGSSKKRKGADADDTTVLDGRKTIAVAKVSSSTSIPKQSFKIGECMRRAASQLTGSPIMKCNNERFQKLDGSADGYDISYQSPEDAYRGRMIDPTEYSSLDELLLQLQFAAQDPMREDSSSSIVVGFFSDFRNSVIQGQCPGMEQFVMDKVTGKRKKVSHSIFGSPETFEFDDMNDTYWTDRVIQNGSEEQASRGNRKKDNQLVLAQPDKPQENRRPYSRKRYSNGNHVLAMEKPVGYVDENAPAELIMNFSEMRAVPSEAVLNRMFKRFGPLKESETEVDRESSRARVIFKKSSDAEVACSSAEKFNIFGPTMVNYQLSYTPTIPFKAPPVVTTQDHEMQLDLSTHDHDMQLDLSTHDHEMQLDLSTHDHDMQLDLSAFEVNLV